MMEAMSNQEFINWQAYFQLQAEDEEAALEEARQNAR
jgi:1,2-phenylacetyl-CoA epoxidase PaaB subunit